MILTRFKNVNDITLPAVELLMPAAVREGDFIDINGQSFRVIGVCWIVETDTDPREATISLIVKVR